VNEWGKPRANTVWEGHYRIWKGTNLLANATPIGLYPYWMAKSEPASWCSETCFPFLQTDEIKSDEGTTLCTLIARWAEADIPDLIDYSAISWVTSSVDSRHKS
jgi:hypothetical protein